MDEKMNVQEQNQAQPPSVKKSYTPPVLTVYGKLTELTAAGTMPYKEQNKHDQINRL